MRILNNKYAKNFDFVMFFAVILIFVIGIANLYGSLSVNHKDFLDPYIVKQIIWFLIALVVMFIIITIDYNIFIEIAYYIYGFIFILIIAVLLEGKIAHGASRWISFGTFSFQPSEFMKIALILALVRYFTFRKDKNSYSIKELLIPFIMIILPVILIAKEPDLGTALIIFFIGITMVFIAGIKRNAMIILTGIALFAGPFLWFRLKPYQKSRILIFLHPAKDYLGAGYNMMQSEIAVGAGRFFGNGFGKGSQSTLNFLPAKHTDFIFSTFMQQFGFLGGLILIGLYFILIVRGYNIVYRTKKLQGFLLGGGALSIITFHTIVNMFMTVGLLPVVGVPLPFFSYGGTSLLVDMSAVAILLNIAIRRYKFQS